MNKTAIKNFAIWARNKLIADIQYRAGLMGITAEGIKAALPQSTTAMEFYDIGTAEPYSIAGDAIRQRKRLVEIISRKEKDSDYPTAYKYILEEVAYTWFNRLIAIRFMEVNDYLPSHIRVLSSESGKVEPDLVTTPFDAGLNFSTAEEETILQLKTENQLDELFRLLFIKQCNALNEILPALFEKTSDYTELLLSLSVVDREGVVYRLVHDIDEDDFIIEKGGQVEIIGWLYQYYNTEPKNAAFAKRGKISQEELPAVTQLFTPDWIVRYMVENSLGRIFVDKRKNEGVYADGRGLDEMTWDEAEAMRIANEEDIAKEKGWKYFLPEAAQTQEVRHQLDKIQLMNEYKNVQDIKIIDPCMGSGHILVYAFDVLMQIYEDQGWSQRDAAQSILEHNLYGLDIDDRAAQLAYFAVMMKARQYDRRILARGITPHIHSIAESNAIGGAYKLAMGDFLLSKEHQETLNYLLEVFYDAKEYGSILQLESRDYAGLLEAWKLTASQTAGNFNISLWYSAVEHEIPKFIEQAIVLTQKYDVVVTNPPYMGSGNMGDLLSNYVKSNYPNSKSDMSTVFMEQCQNFCNPHGMYAMINIPVWMTQSSFFALRKSLIHNITFVNMLHLGRGVFGSDFGTVAFVIRNGVQKNYTATYMRLFEGLTQVDSNEVKEGWFFERKGIYLAKQYLFEKIDGLPIAYWVTKGQVAAFSFPALNTFAEPRQGFATGDNERFLRFWQEVDFSRIAFNCKNRDEANLSGRRWFPCNKGGAFRRWFGNNERVVNWEHDGIEMTNFSGSVIRNTKYYFRQGMTWSTATMSKLSMRFSPVGFLFESKGSVCFPVNNTNLHYLLALLNTKIVEKLLLVLAPTVDYHEGPLGRIPVILSKEHFTDVSELCKRCICLSKKDWDAFEISWDFQRHPLTPSACERQEQKNSQFYSSRIEKFGRIAWHYEKWELECEDRFVQLKANEEELNHIFINIYGLQDELTPEVADKDVTVHRIFDTKHDVPESMQGSSYVRTKRDEIVSLLSYAVGCMFGRYTIYADRLFYVGGPWEYGVIVEKLSESARANGFEPWNPSGLFLPDEYNVIPITDEEYLKDDIITRLCDWLKTVYGADTLEENLDFIAGVLGNKGDSSREIIRNYFLKDFFKDHCKTYQKRPIYWLFDSGKQNGFKSLIYLHRYTPDTIGNLRVDYLHKMQRVYESEISRMQDMIDNSQNAREVAASTKRKEKLQKQLKECRDYDEMIAHLALSRIELDLDDGVKINYEKVQTASDGKKYPVLAKI